MGKQYPRLAWNSYVSAIKLHRALRHAEAGSRLVKPVRQCEVMPRAAPLDPRLVHSSKILQAMGAFVP
jgi:hypothetical protein